MPSLYVIAGHGAGDPGACANGYGEAERVRALAARLADIGGDAVEVLDTSRNWYADGGISGLSLPAGAQMLELHMDSAGAGARGGHVVVNGAYAPDGYDIALADAVGSMFPGRSQTLVGRTDLANPNRAAARGISYRLLECCFISSAEDLEKFNSHLDGLARAILGAFGIGCATEGEDMDLNDRITDGYIMDGSTYATVGNCLYWAESCSEKAYNNTVALRAEIAALAAAVDTLAKSQGADPEAIAAAVSEAVERKLEGIKLDVTVE